MTNGMIVLLWVAVGFYAVSAVAFVITAVFGLKRLLIPAIAISAVGLIPHGAAMILRWIMVGHAPYLGFFEIISLLVLFGVIGLLILTLYKRSLALVGVVIMPLAFLLLGGATLAPKSAIPITPSLASYWLGIHVAFAQLSFTAFFVAFALGIFYLIQDNREKKQLPVGADGSNKTSAPAGLWARLPKLPLLDNLIFRLTAVGFILWTIMIISGAIWANQSWGRYWSWDPIEVWSLIAWIVYAIYLHLRLTMHWRGKKSAIYVVAAMLVVAFAFVGVPFVYNSIHAAYLSFG